MVVRLGTSRCVHTAPAAVAARGAFVRVHGRAVCTVLRDPHRRALRACVHAGGKTKKRKGRKKRVKQAGAVKLIDEDDDWRTYAPKAVANMDFHTADQGGACP